METLSFSSSSIWIAIGLLAYQAVLTLYRLYLSPLAAFSGPKLTAATGWYETYYDVFCGGQFVFKIEEWHRQYGPMVRINPGEVHVADAEFYEVLYSTKSRYDKPVAWKYRFGLPLSTFDAIDHDYHRHRRQAIGPLFSRRRVVEYGPQIQKFAKPLRLALGISQRLVRINPHGQIHYGDFVIPAGVPFGMSSCLQHRDARIFPRPNEFRPERWLAQSGTGPRKQPLARYSVPFGRGPRMCLGMNLALAEIHIVLANVFRRFQMELSETRADAVDMAADFFIPIPQKGTRGVRVLVA